MEDLLLTLLSAFIVGYVFHKLKITGGMIIGAIIGSAIFNITTSRGYMTYEYKFIAQAFSGAVIGCTIKRDDLKEMKHVIKPILFVLSMFMVLNIIVGFIIYNISSMDLMTSMMSVVPGGLSNIPIIAIDFGADGSQVATMQFARMVAGIGVFPTLIKRFEKYDKVSISEISCLETNTNTSGEQTEVTKTKKEKYGFIALGLLFALVGGYVGEVIGLSGGVLLFSMIFTIAIKLKFEEIEIPSVFRRIAQVLSGAYIGYTMTLSDVYELKNLIIPIIVVIIFFFINCVVTGFILHKFFKFSLIEGMLSAAPAGASDMALISADMGVSSPRLVMIQVARLITVVSVFPQVIKLVVDFVQ